MNAFIKLYRFATLILALILAGCASQPRLVLSQTTYENLPAWNRDNHSESLIAFQRSCREILKRNPYAHYGKLPASGKVFHWQETCRAANQVDAYNKFAAQTFFETWFAPYEVRNNAKSNGLFTGYYLPLIHGNIKQSHRYAYPIYGVPNNLVAMKRQQLHFLERAAINRGTIHANTPVLVWADNPLDVYFAQIQGSAIVELPNHKRFTIGYAANNGHSYTPIGRILRDEYGIPKEQISMQFIRSWLETHPAQTPYLLNRNKSYVFFRILKNAEPLGAEQIELTPARSLAVDTRYIPLGSPIWLNTQAPNMQRLMIAQDTGGAIKGIVRGDVYWGAGKTAEQLAGYMQSDGQYWILLPKRISS